jgi:WD40 repeat protein
VAFTPDGKTIATAGTDGSVRQWDRATGKPLTRFDTEPGYGREFAFTTDAALVATSGPRVWTTSTGQSVSKNTTAKKETGLCAPAFSPDGTWLVSAGSPWKGAEANRTAGYAVPAGTEMLKLKTAPDGGVEAVAISPDGKVVAEASQAGIIRASSRIILWGRDGNEIRRFGEPRYFCKNLAFSPDQKTLAVALEAGISGFGGIQIWDVGSGRLTERINKSNSVLGLVFSPDGSKLAAGDGNSVVVWDTAEWKVIRQFKGHDGQVHSLAFSADGKWLASGSADTTVLVWAVDQPK